MLLFWEFLKGLKVCLFHKSVQLLSNFFIKSILVEAKILWEVERWFDFIWWLDLFIRPLNINMQLFNSFWGLRPQA